MSRVPVFYSFHYDNDVHRVQLIRNMGVLEGDEPVNPNEWQSLKDRGDRAVENWIDENMKYKRAVIVLIGEDTAYRPWVKYEIKRAWELKKGLFGIYIHNLPCMRTGTCRKGSNPFKNWNIGNYSMADFIHCHDPVAHEPYKHIAANLQNWVGAAINQARARANLGS